MLSTREYFSMEVCADRVWTDDPWVCVQVGEVDRSACERLRDTVSFALRGFGPRAHRNYLKVSS